MMGTSSKHQKQKLTLTETSPLARYTNFKRTHRAKKSKRATVLGLGILGAVTLPALVYASSNPQLNPFSKSNASQSTSIKIESNTSSQPEEVFSISEETTEQPGSETAPSDSNGDAMPNVDVTVNGQSIPVTEGTTSRVIENDDGSTVEVDVSAHSSTSDSSESSRSSTRVRTHSSTSSSTSLDSTITTRGSP